MYGLNGYSIEGYVIGSGRAESRTCCQQTWRMLPLILGCREFNRIFDMYRGETFCLHLHGLVLIFVSHRHFLVVQWSRDTISKQRSLFRRGLIDDIRIADDDLFESTNFHEACTQGIYCLNS
jgi:hypothetical protein